MSHGTRKTIALEGPNFQWDPLSMILQRYEYIQGKILNLDYMDF